MMWILRALWLVVAYDLSHYRYIDDVTGNLLSLFCSTWRAVLRMFLRLFRIKANESLEKSLARAFYKEEKWWNRDKKSSWPLTGCLNYKKSSQQLPWCVMLRQTRCFAKCFRQFSAYSKKRRRKTFRRNCVQGRLGKKRRSRDEK